MKIKIYLYQKETKYTQVEPDAVLVYDNVRELTVKKIPKETILETSDEEMVDEFDEYLFIEFDDAEGFNQATYRNSHVDVFRLTR